MEVADYFGLKAAKAKAIAKEVGKSVSTWRNEALRDGIKKMEIDRMASAFEHMDLRKAQGDKCWSPIVVREPYSL